MRDATAPVNQQIGFTIHSFDNFGNPLDMGGARFTVTVSNDRT